MKVSYDWLSTMVELPEDPSELSREFIRTGTEVEAIETVGEAFDHVVTAQVLSKTAHPDSDHLWVCSVDVGANNVDAEGNPEPLQIVCGAQNFNEGDHIVTAMVGAVLPGDVKIKKGKLRGVVSMGMNCSARELGLSSDHEGIWILPQDAPVGMPLSQYLGSSDVVLDCEITPNRPDCLSMIGIAREVGAIYDRDFSVELPQVREESGASAEDTVSVELLDEGLCDRYVARVVRNVKVGPSPDWLVQRLNACGVRTHNNVVDITNYVMMLTGQPLHAFDLSAFEERDGKRAVAVRAAHEGEQFRTLDDVERTLSAGMGLIATGEAGATPVALAGVMGGMDSEVTDATVDVLIESACFNAGRTSHTSRDLALISDASIRFERQVDETGCVDVANIACALIEDLAGGAVAPGCVDVYPAPRTVEPVTLRLARVHAICGAAIEPAFIEKTLGRLGCTVARAGEGEDLVYTVTPPTFRPDLPREIDLIEEILRIWGMGRVEATIPAAKNHIGGLTREQRLTRKVGQVLRSCGLNETMNFSFAAPGDLERIGMTAEGRGCAVELMNPLVAEQTEMRRSLIPGLLQSVEFNITHSTANVQLYEIGTLFFGRENASAPKEREAVAGVMSGAMGDVTWNYKPMPLRFFDGKGVVEELLEQLRIPKVRFREATGDAYAFLQPGRCAEVLSGGTVLGWVGEIHPDAREAYGIDIPVVAFELNLDAMLAAAGTQEAYREFSQFPSVEHDLAIVVNEDVTCEDLERRLRSAGGKLLVGVRLFDVYRDPVRVGAGKKSMAFALTYRSDDHTLTSEEVEKAHSKLVAKVCKATGGEVRS
ncbi:phenylalanine--tRNA ligase subunit beta [Collinsella stercoris]|uniref:Phenylalanine--tRNA ligase beta subunit n=1 Tax=Collinsella stercoris DSM 13279 TaxID=445975 RepID=B6G7K2_9ACTN|nr:phenylalanine--tRNA ligase subunit beta [Collinsella stercoris]EEA91736.1 phenylalanine--tRNA ligase, beta subunit [Collinsella stercoris DSM 13279]UEA44994.1 phenylalanine--tRNA ligase subunit beta [Collinsella stercoris DSM 13279]UWP12484.1 phenylalanine--tRNA ligase subunit beta [Collinsella stercoris]